MNGLDWTFAVMEFGYGVLALVVGIIVLAVAPGKRANQALSWLLIVEGISMGGIASQMREWTWAGARWVAASDAVADIGFGIVPALYLFFVGMALDGPIARALRRPWVVAIVSILSIALAWALATTDASVVNARSQLTLAVLNLITLIGSGLVGLLAAFQNLRLAEGENRRRAKAYLAAFVARDVGYVFGYSGLAINYFASADGEPMRSLLLIFLQGCWLVFITFLSYGIFTGSIVDLDRKFRVGISNTTAVAAVAIMFAVGVEVLESMFPGNDTWTSIAIAVALAALFRPIQSLAERGARRMLPGQAVSAEQYAEAIQRAMADGVITPRERRMLDDLQARVR